MHASTLVLHRSGDLMVDVDQGRAIAESIPGAKFVELIGENHILFLGDFDEIVDEIEEFVTGVRPPPQLDRVLATVSFTSGRCPYRLKGRLTPLHEPQCHETGFSLETLVFFRVQCCRVRRRSWFEQALDEET